MHRRTGVTLVEVLIAIFVMGIGLMALLTLFPLGALRMAQAIQDTHSRHSAANATAIASANSFRYDTNVTTAFGNPGGGLTNLTTKANYTGAGYPVFVDAVGYQAYAGNYKTWVGGSPSNAIPRRSPTAITGLGAAQKQQSIDGWFTFLDDYNFGDDGLVPASPNGTRDYQYSWAYLFRKPRFSSQAVELTVVVYRGRPSTITASQPLEYSYTAHFNPSTRVVTLTTAAGQVAPRLNPGGWFLDVTTNNGIPNAVFYRAVTVTPTSNNTTDVEVNVPFRNFTQTATNVAGTIVIQEGVIDVYEKGAGWAGQ